jgi:hypothetical protein
MSTQNRLGGRVQRKGAALRPLEMPQRGEPAPAPAEPTPPALTPVTAELTAQKTALTLKLSADQYERLRTYGFKHKLSHQKIMETALLRFLDSEGT